MRRKWEWAVYFFAENGKVQSVVSAPNYWFARQANILCLSQQNAEYHAEQAGLTYQVPVRMIQPDGTSIYRDYRTSTK